MSLHKFIRVAATGAVVAGLLAVSACDNRERPPPNPPQVAQG